MSTDTYKLVADIQTGEDGEFVVNLKPGTYHLMPFLVTEGYPVAIGPSVQVTVEKKDFTVVELSVIFGPM